MAMYWGYTEDTGPTHWCEKFPDANGKRQSPINIVTKDARVDAALGPLKLTPARCADVVNNGHTVQVNIDSSDTNMSGGPLKHNYRFAQFHFHWGSKDGQGSEHTVDGKPYDAELHLVHWNTDMFKAVGEALPKDKGLAVLTAFIKVGKEHPAWTKLVALLNSVKCKNDKFSIQEAFDALSLLPENKTDYWTYEGSLTTPPCYESARFIIYREPVEVSAEQISALRGLLSYCKGETPCCNDSDNMCDNYRPTMPLNGRVVTASFQA